ncbi:hypothetical protein AAF712_012730 [Marasmius tenuissimus]|uniref:Uncharacterized protein n=1 Tax=Marasmius tenuissimus TaxID=585030 RepID=A0ABR2ZFR2_9AGAR|nr:hypothetical protein PM082_011204 [Marasmius tenuissimus]
MPGHSQSPLVPSSSSQTRHTSSLSLSPPQYFTHDASSSPVPPEYPEDDEQSPAYNVALILEAMVENEREIIGSLFPDIHESLPTYQRHDGRRDSTTLYAVLKAQLQCNKELGRFIDQCERGETSSVPVPVPAEQSPPYYLKLDECGLPDSDKEIVVGIYQNSQGSVDVFLERVHMVFPTLPRRTLLGLFVQLETAFSA